MGFDQPWLDVMLSRSDMTGQTTEHQNPWTLIYKICDRAKNSSEASLVFLTAIWSADVIAIGSGGRMKHLTEKHHGIYPHPTRWLL